MRSDLPAIRTLTVFLALPLAIGVPSGADESPAKAARKNPYLSEESNALLTQTQWTRVARSDLVELFLMLAAQTESNYKRIRTWKGSYDLKIKQHLDKARTLTRIDGVISKEDAHDISQDIEMNFKFVIDLVNNKVNREALPIKSKSVSKDSRLPGGVVPIVPAEERSLVTPGQFIHIFPNDRYSSIRVSPDNPETHNKRVAFCETSEATENQELGRLIDPRVFFGFDIKKRFWTDFELSAKYTKEASAGLGKASGDDAAGPSVLRKATVDGSTLYYQRGTYRLPTGKDLVTSTILSGKYGFYPLCSVFEVEGMVVQATEWAWMERDGIFVPERYKTLIFSKPGGDLVYGLEARHKECRLNEPIDPLDFDYAGLGMRNGDLILNRIDKKVYILRRGIPISLGAYDSRPPASSTGSRSARLREPWRWILIGGNGLILAVLLHRAVGRRRQEPETRQ